MHIAFAHAPFGHCRRQFGTQEDNEPRYVHPDQKDRKNCECSVYGLVGREGRNVEAKQLFQNFKEERRRQAAGQRIANPDRRVRHHHVKNCKPAELEE